MCAGPKDLFKVDSDWEKLRTSQATSFHNLVAKTLFVTKHACPDTSTAVTFLTTRVQESNFDDWKKLSHLMEYLRGTAELPLTLNAK